MALSESAAVDLRETFRLNLTSLTSAEGAISLQAAMDGEGLDQSTTMNEICRELREICDRLGALAQEFGEAYPVRQSLTLIRGGRDA